MLNFTKLSYAQSSSILPQGVFFRSLYFVSDVGSCLVRTGVFVFLALALLLPWPTDASAGLDFEEGTVRKDIGVSTAPKAQGVSKTKGDLALEEAIVQTEAAVAKVKLDEKQLARAKEVIKGLNYTNMRILRVFCGLPSITPEGIMDALRRLPQSQISYDQLIILEHFVALPGVDTDMAWLLLKKLGGLNYVSGRVALAISQAKNLQPRVMLALLDRLASLKEPGLWAFKAYLEVPGQTADTVDKGLLLIDQMTEKQCWAAEMSNKIAGMTPELALLNMSHLPRLSNTNASNARSMFQLPGMSPAASLAWITNYFLLSQENQEALFFTMNAEQQSQLLLAFADGSEYLIWKINNLHDITDVNGQEVGIRVLSSCPLSTLREIFQRLDGNVQARFNGEFSAGLTAGRGPAIAALRRATAAARMQAAKDCTTANAYILLSRGSDLYDSSFREILVPVLKARIDSRFGGNLLAFLKTIDQKGVHVSDFIISLAQKGKLVVFFPVPVAEQEQVLDLVARSAFRDEKSLILFSATFMTLLETIQPQTRTYLIAKMLTAIREKDSVFSTQLRVILQYYIQEYPQLVGEVDKIRIRLMMSQYGTLALEQYVKTSFAEWKMDSKLSSLSIFQSDDDGSQSYRSNCQTLMAHGYRPRLSTTFSLLAAEGAQGRAVGAQLKGLLGAPSQNLGAIQEMQTRYPLVVDWVKSMNGLEISHSVVVYHDVSHQQELLRQFLKGGHEMFVQRGHSYWRREQLLDPLQELLKTGAVTDADLTSKQRFLSLGSCGGIRVYSELAMIFHNKVDILATVGTGKAIINDPYNQFLFELVASRSDTLSWKAVSDQAAVIFKHGMGEDYLQPGSLPAILHKIMDQKQIDKQAGGQGSKPAEMQSGGGLEVRPSVELDPNRN